MSNVVSIGLPKRPSLSQRQGALVQNFALHRRGTEDVFWLKENAELLNILASSGAALPVQDLEVYRSFYDGLEERMRFFPQYYRFLLSICLDLEDLGMPGDQGQRLCRDVQSGRFAACEVSDLQRAEAQRLLARRGCGRADDALTERLHCFMSRTQTFALPNKKAAYELTHIVFYLSEYGARDPALPEAATTSLEYAGLLAFLDQDVDLLSELCIALRFAGQTPSAIWEDWLAEELRGFALKPAPAGPATDAYHEYLVTSWWAHVAGMTGFPGTPCRGGLEITRQAAPQGPLRAISEVMYHLGRSRTGNWDEMRDVLTGAIATDHRRILEGAVSSSPRFSDFFERFSRAR